MTDWETPLRTLPYPEPPPSTNDAVMARLRALEASRSGAQTLLSPRMPARRKPIDWRAWGIAAGIASAAPASALQLFGGSLIKTLLAPRLSWMDIVRGLPDFGPETILTVAGVALYLVAIVWPPRAEEPGAR